MSCSAHGTGRFMCEEYQSSMSFFVAGAMFGEVGTPLFVAGSIWRIFGREAGPRNVVFSIQNDKMVRQDGTSNEFRAR